MLDHLTRQLAEFMAAAPENRVQADYALSPELVGQPLFAPPLLAVGDASDPLFEALRAPEAVGAHFRTPEQWLPGAKRVVSFFLPFSPVVKRSNLDGADPSPLWLHSRIEGQGFLLQVCRRLQQLLEAEGHTVRIPGTDPAFAAMEKPRVPGAPGYTSNWSERHVAWICGLGTFGLSRGLITEKGMAGRFCSLVTTGDLPVTVRPYTGLYDYCTGCGACIRRCSVGAITREGKAHEPCSDFLNDTKVRFAPRYGCGKCQVGVPCADGIPQK